MKDINKILDALKEIHDITLTRNIAETEDWEQHYDRLLTQINEISGKFINKNYKLAFKRDYDSVYKDCEYYILGIIDPETSEFKDFYYSSGIEYEEFQRLIPPEFQEACESCYEFSPRKNKNKKAINILKKYGYIDYDKS